jgi:hypothetical protein
MRGTHSSGFLLVPPPLCCSATPTLGSVQETVEVDGRVVGKAIIPCLLSGFLVPSITTSVFSDSLEVRAGDVAPLLGSGFVER